jgi:hypothetical protein
VSRGEADDAVLPRTSAPRVLDASRQSILQAVLNEIVPPRADLPGAGDLGVDVAIERSLTAEAGLRRLFLDGLSDLAIVRFLELTPAQRVDVLRRFEQEQPAFFSTLVEYAYRGYYTLPEVHAAIGYTGPPQPRGGVLPPFDLESLAKQRRRQPFWRPV